MAKTTKKKNRRGAKRTANNTSSFPTTKFLASIVGLGVLVGGIYWLATLSSKDQATTNEVAAPVEQSKPEEQKVIPKEEEEKAIEFAFYDQLANDAVIVDVEPAAKNSAPKQYFYVLQAASFKQLKDAERARAELILKGMKATIKTVTSDSGTQRHRLLVGPYQQRNAMDTARTKLINMRYNPLVLKRERKTS